MQDEGVRILGSGVTRLKADLSNLIKPGNDHTSFRLAVITN